MLKSTGLHKTRMHCLLGLLVLVLAPGTVHAGLITNLTVQSASIGTTAQMSPEKAINGAGLPGNTPALSGTHSTSWDHHWWGPDSMPQITIDLEGNYEVDTIHVWNYNSDAKNNLSARGFKNAEIYVAPDTNEVSLVKLATDGSGSHDNGYGNFSFPRAPWSADYIGFDLDLSGITNTALLKKVRLIRLQALDTHGDPKGGLAEVQFGGTAYVDPPEDTVIVIR